MLKNSVGAKKMSKEIKFRAWDTKENRYTDAEIFISNLSKIYRIFWQELEPVYGNEIIVELSTGLTDKNGKERHIGDIVSEHQGDFIGEIVQKPSGEYRIAWVGIFGGESVLYDHQSLCEIIGNIHENPELIEKEKE